MIDYYGYITTMCWRVGVALEELDLPFTFHSVSLAKGEHKASEHLARNPFGLVPVIVDREPAGGGEPITVWESGAILLYLGEKTGRLVPRDGRERAEFYQWFFWVITGYGAALGQSAGLNEEKKYRVFGPKTDFDDATYAHFTEASRTAHAALDGRLEGREWICGDFSMADIAAIGSTVPLRLHGVDDLAAYPHLARWYERMRARPAVERGLACGREEGDILPEYYRAALFDER